MTVNRAWKIFLDEYEWAKRQKWIRKPIAYAMYQAWKWIDENENRK